MRSSVFIPIVLVCVFALVVLFGSRCSREPDCSGITLGVAQTAITQGDRVSFSINNPIDFETATWNINDTSVESTSQDGFSHTFDKPGTYTVSLMLDGREDCMILTSVDVQPEEEKEDTSDVVIVVEQFSGKIEAPTRARVGKKVTFKVEGEGAESFEWKFGESGEIDSEEASPAYAYETPGEYPVSVRVNEGATLTHSITITPRPEVRCATMSAQAFANNMNNSNFGAVLKAMNGNRSTPLTYQGQKTTINNFYRRCEIEGITLSAGMVQLNKNSQGCITSIVIQ